MVPGLLPLFRWEVESHVCGNESGAGDGLGTKLLGDKHRLYHSHPSAIIYAMNWICVLEYRTYLLPGTVPEFASRMHDVSHNIDHVIRFAMLYISGHRLEV